MDKVKNYCIGLTDKDNEKLNFIMEAEDVQSRAEVMRRLIDRAYREVQHGTE